MDTNKIFSKFNIKNYNNELEKILENKPFSMDVKNLLLSMLYKIENAYKDYITVKRQAFKEKELMGIILKIIKEKCFEIELLDPEKENSLKIDKKYGRILCYPNEKSLLSSILYMGENDLKLPVPYNYVEDALKKMIQIGSNSSLTEVLRDFNGWSWDILVSEIENLKYNIIYESLLLIDGENLIGINITDEEKKNSILFEKDNKEYFELLNLLYQIVLDIDVEENEDELKNILNIKRQKEEQLELFNNKKKLVEEMTNEKKECIRKIDKIDRMINDTELLKKEYQERNSKLPNKEKIFSISHLADQLEKERKQLLEKIKKCNKMIEPKKFVKEKEKLEKEVQFLNNVNFEKEENQDKIINFCKEFLNVVEKKIDKLEEKADIINWIYKIRYYRYIPFDEQSYLKDREELEEDFAGVIKLLTKKAQTQKIWDVFAENEELTYDVIKEVFNSKIINLENVNIMCKYEDGVLYVSYYDAYILETNVEIKREHIKIKKKIKLFI